MLRHLPNALCVLRMLLAVPVAWLLARGEYETTLWVFAFAAVTDGLDGFLAKRFKWETELGKALDPLADKILLVTAFITLTLVSHVPWWLAVAVVARDVIIAFGAISFHYTFGPVQGHPTVISKLNTLLQIAYVMTVVGAQAMQLSAPTTIVVLTTLVMVTTVASGVDYVAMYAQRAVDISRRRAGRENPQ